MTVDSGCTTFIFCITVKYAIVGILSESKFQESVNSKMARGYAMSGPSAIYQIRNTGLRDVIALQNVISRGIEDVLYAEFQERGVYFIVGFQFSESIYVKILNQRPMLIGLMEPLELRNECEQFVEESESELTMPKAKPPKTVERSLFSFCETPSPSLSTMIYKSKITNKITCNGIDTLSDDLENVG
jgi:hypothetical protein